MFTQYAQPHKFKLSCRNYIHAYVLLCTASLRAALNMLNILVLVSQLVIMVITVVGLADFMLIASEGKNFAVTASCIRSAANHQLAPLIQFMRL